MKVKLMTQYFNMWYSWELFEWHIKVESKEDVEKIVDRFKNEWKIDIYVSNHQYISEDEVEVTLTEYVFPLRSKNNRNWFTKMRWTEPWYFFLKIEE